MNPHLCPTCGRRTPRSLGGANLQVTAHRRALAASVAYIEASGRQPISGAVYAHYLTLDLQGHKHVSDRRARDYLRDLADDGLLTERALNLGKRGRTILYGTAQAANPLPLVPRASEA